MRREKQILKTNQNKEAAVSRPRDDGSETCNVVEYYAGKETGKKSKLKRHISWII